jgi:glycerol uptake facilitator protein
VQDRGPAAYAAELIGTFLLVLFIVLVLSVNSAGGIGVTDWAVIGLLHVFILAMLVASLGGTSGAHFNPAITVALATIRKITPVSAAIYVLMQLVGAVLAALVAKAVLHDPGAAAHYGATKVSALMHGKALSGAVGELIGTFALMWAVMGTAVNPRAEREWAPLIIGGTLGLAIFVFGPLTGGGINPARAFGPSLVGHGEDIGRFLYIYVAGPVVGAVAAAVAYRAIALEPAALPTEGERPIDKLG